jgi:hypothetical protein
VGEDWRAQDQDLDAIAGARKADPFAMLGSRRTAAGCVIRVFAPEAISIRSLTADGELMAELPRRNGDFFEALIPSAKERPHREIYRRLGAHLIQQEGADGVF